MSTAESLVESPNLQEKQTTIASDGEKLRCFARCIREGIAYVRKHATNAVNAACTVGENLLAARAYVQHGAWEKWVVENTGLSPRTARAYMELNECLSSVAPGERQRVAELPVRRVIKAISSLKSEARPVTALALEDAAATQETHDPEKRMQVVRNAIAGLEELASALAVGSAADLSNLKSLGQKVRSALRVILEIKHEPQALGSAPTH